MTPVVEILLTLVVALYVAILAAISLMLVSLRARVERLERGAAERPAQK